MLDGIYSPAGTMAAFGMTLAKASLQAAVCVYLLMLLCPLVQSRECRRIFRMQRIMNERSLRLLAQMKDTSLNECPHENPDFKYPFGDDKLTVTKANLRGIISHIRRMFDNDLTKVTTEKNKADVEKLQMLLSEMLERWTDCLFKEMNSPDFQVRKQPKKDRKIKMYFQRMKEYLKSQGYSSCAWATVRTEVQKTMRFVAQSTDISIKRHQKKRHPKKTLS